MSINKVREAAREGTNQHSDIYICIYTYIYIYIYIPIRVSGGLRFAKIVVCEWPRRGKGKQCVVAQCQVIQSIDSGTVNVAAVCLVHLSSCALAPSIIAWADCLQSECAGHPTACASRGVAQCVDFFWLSSPCVVLSVSQAQYLPGCSLGCFKSAVCFIARCDGEPTQLPMIFVLIRSFSFVRSHTF